MPRCSEIMVSRVVEGIRVYVPVVQNLRFGSKSSPRVVSVLSSNMLLNVAQNVLHMVVLRVLSMSVVVGATPVSMRSRRELHVHDWRMLV